MLTPPNAIETAYADVASLPDRDAIVEYGVAFQHGFRAGRAEGLISLISAVEDALSESLDHGTPVSPAELLGNLSPTGTGLVVRPRKQPCILVVDDESTNVDLLSDTFADEYEVLSANEGWTALTTAAAEQPDLILLDVMMPGMSGYEVCRQLKSGASTAGIPVMFVTCLGDVVAETTGLELGAVDYITKPIHPRAVLARVQNQIQLKLAQDKLVRLATLEQGLRTNLLEALESKAEFASAAVGSA